MYTVCNTPVIMQEIYIADSKHMNDTLQISPVKILFRLQIFQSLSF